MLSDFTVITQHFPNNTDTRITGISDLHVGAREHMRDAWKEFSANVLSDPNWYVILVGDMINNGIKTAKTNTYEEILRPRDQKRVVTEMLKPLADNGRILCGVPGNHELRSVKETDDEPFYDIMCKLDLEERYRENMAFLKVQFGEKNGHGLRNPTYKFCVAHGSGGGTTGSSVNRKEGFGYVIDGIDCLVTGHDHKPFNTFPSKIVFDAHNNKVSTKPFVVLSCSSWLDYGGYALRGMLKPSSHIPQEMILHGKQKIIEIRNFVKF